jgi:beta-phosphoglucomutase-like phosphatase (HAD superfamily)
MTSNASPFDSGRPRPVPTVLDTLRARIDPDDFDAVVFSLESVVADLGFGDVRRLPGSVAWIDRLRDEGKRIALVYSGDNARRALELAGIADRFDVVESGPRSATTITRVLDDLGVPAGRAAVVDVVPEGLNAAREAGCVLAIALARASATPEELRQGGAHAVVADLQELLGPTS